MGPYERRSGAMSVEQRGPAVCRFSGNQEGKDEMTKASVNLQDLRRRIYVKAKADTTWRFWGMYVHVCKMETLREAYALAQNNDGAPGSDGVTFAAIEAQGVEALLRGDRGNHYGGHYGTWLTVASLVLVRQMPGSAKASCSSRLRARSESAIS